MLVGMCSLCLEQSLACIQYIYSHHLYILYIFHCRLNKFLHQLRSDHKFEFQAYTRLNIPYLLCPTSCDCLCNHYTFLDRQGHKFYKLIHTGCTGFPIVQIFFLDTLKYTRFCIEVEEVHSDYMMYKYSVCFYRYHI
jgi:hypothetical protein